MSPLLYAKLAIGACLLAGSFFMGFKIEESRWQAEKIKIQNEAIEHENKVLSEQGAISQQSEKEKNELQNRYDGVIAMYRNSLRSNSGATGGNPSAGIPSQGLRLLEPDAEVLIGFARSCSQSEIERNEVIQMYEALSK